MSSTGVRCSMLISVMTISVLAYMSLTDVDASLRTKLSSHMNSVARQRATGVTNVEDTQYSTDSSIASVPLNISQSTLLKLGFPLTDFHADSDNFVFVTAGGNRHFHFAMDAIALVQKWFPNRTIYYYDLGNTGAKHVDKMRQLCNVKYRKFDYSVYPKHVKNLYTYAFKPLLIHELLHKHSNIFWMDSSIRFKTGEFSAVINQATSEGRGIMTFDNCGHSNYAATHYLMYRYLPISKEVAANTSMRGASAIYIKLTEQLYDRVIRWWFLCALVNGCIAPTHQRACRFHGRDKYASCHRYDQSALNILLVNYFNGNDTSYFSRYNVLTNNRGSRNKQLLRICDASQHKAANNNTTAMMSRNFFV